MSDGRAPVGAARPPLSVLLLEDSRFDAELLAEHLRASHPHAALHWVAARAGFVAALEAGAPDVVLSDYEIPGYSGLDALEDVRERYPGVPFIFVSGVIGEDNAVEMLKRGATDYVSKSRLSRLSVVIDRALREASALDARVRAESQLHEADALYGSVVDALPDYAVMLLDPAGAVREWNRGAREVFGHERLSMRGRSAALLFTEEDRQAGAFEGELREALATGKAHAHRWMVRADGTRVRADGIVTPLFTAAGSHSGFCKIVHDVTAAHEHAEALRAAKDEAERANRAKDRFLAMLSHELRTPLTPIAAAAHVLERFATVPERHRDLLPMIRRNVDLESRLIADLLDLTTLSAGKIRLSRSPVDMHMLVHRIVDMLGSSVRDKNQRLVVDLDAPRPVVDADEARLHQVVWNVVRNAVKFTPAGGEIRLLTANDGDRFVFRCVDTGIGIAPESLPRIFSAFEQAEESVGREFGGLGLGLAIARGLVHEHGGTLSAHSDGRGKGTTLTLELPDAADMPVPAQPPVEPAAPPAGGPRRVLLVEDNVDAAEALQMVLEGYGHSVTHVGTCAAAFAAANATPFDIVVSDLGLPDGDGIEVGRRLSAAAPVIALSGYGTPKDRQASAEAGFAGHVVKPADPQALHALMMRVLAARAPR